MRSSVVGGKGLWVVVVVVAAVMVIIIVAAGAKVASQDLVGQGPERDVAHTRFFVVLRVIYIAIFGHFFVVGGTTCDGGGWSSRRVGWLGAWRSCNQRPRTLVAVVVVVAVVLGIYRRRFAFAGNGHIFQLAFGSGSLVGTTVSWWWWWFRIRKLGRAFRVRKLRRIIVFRKVSSTAVWICTTGSLRKSCGFVAARRRRSR